MNLAKNKYILPIVAAFVLMISASAGWAQVLDTTGSPNQLGIASVYLTGQGNSKTGPVVHCSPGDSTRLLNFVGRNFNTGNPPRLLIDLGAGAYPTWMPLIPVDNTPATLATGPYYVEIDCSNFSLYAAHRLVVSTGNGPVYNDAVTFDFAVIGPRGPKGDKGDQGNNGIQGPKGDKGDKGDNGNDGIQGPNGDKGDKGDKGDNGDKGDKGDHGNDGAQGPKGDKGDKGDNGGQGGQGPKGDKGDKGDQGPQGPQGNAFGYHRKFNSAGINGTSSVVLSQVVSGSNSYIVDAKVNAPFANGQKQVSCTLVAIQNGVTTEIDRVDTQLLGSNQVTAQGGLPLNGVFTAANALTPVTINVSCATGGDSRTLSNGRMSIIGVNVLVP